MTKKIDTLADLTPDGENFNRHTEFGQKLLEDSLRKFGAGRSILVDKDGNIIAGNSTTETAAAIGMEDVIVVPTDGKKLVVVQRTDLSLDSPEGRELALADNMTALKGIDLDLAKVQETLGDDLAKAWGMEIPEVQKQAQEDDFDPDSVTETVCKKGDIWKLGNHRLMCGDSTDAGDVALLMDGEKADMCFTDPPYNFETEGGGILGGANSMKQVRENKVDKFDPSILHNYAKTNIYFHNKALIKSYIELAEKEGLNYDLAIYKKRGLPNYAGHLMTDVEYIAIIGEQAPNIGLEMKYYSKVFEGNKDQDNDLSYSKPIAICDKFLRLYSKEEDNIIDLFGGSGTTLIAAEQLNRKCYMMELDPHYCDVIIARWEKLTGNKAERISNGND